MTATAAETATARSGPPLLHTKLFMPRPSSGTVSRPRISARLGEGKMRKLTLVSAPPGSGKTTLLSEWINGSGAEVAWVSLDESDNDPVRFWSYVVAALQRVEGHLGESVPAMLQASTPLPIDRVLTDLLNDASLVARERPIVLALDDYHAISNDAIHNALAFLLDYLPGSLRVAMTSRVDPPLPLSRLRAGGQLTEIREEDLRFTREEATTFLNTIMGLRLTHDEVAMLEEKTEGWVAGIQLAAISMQGRTDPGAFIEAFAGSHRYIVDYLSEEVLDGLPDRLQTFLVATSVLDRLTAPLCDALTGRNDGREMLERIEEMNLFIIPLDDRRRWYRYHHLFAGVLRNRLENTDPEAGTELHRRASGWYEENNLIDQAVGHALAAREFDRAVGLFESTAEEIVSRSEIATLKGWAESLPEEVIAAHPRLSLLYAWTLMSINHDEERVSELLERAERGLNEEKNGKIDPAERTELLGIHAAIEAYRAIGHGNVERAEELSRSALELLPERKHFWRGSLAMSMGAIYSVRGNLHDAIGSFSEAAVMGKASGNAYTALVASYNLAGLLESCGELRQAERTYREALEWVKGHGARRLAVVGTIHEGFARLLTQRNELDEAAVYIERSIALGRRRGDLSILRAAQITRATLLHARGEITGAHEAIKEAQTIERDHIHPHWSEWAGLVRAQLALREGDVEAASRWARDFEARADDGNPHKRRLNQLLMLIRVYIAEGRYEKALTELGRLYDSAVGSNREKRAVEILGLQAVALDALGRNDEAVEAIRRAIELGEPEGYVRAFVDCGEPMERIMRAAARRGADDQTPRERTLAAYALRIADIIRAESGGTEREEPALKPLPTSSPSNDALLEPLSEREIEVLRLVADGFSNRLIAERLFVAEGTVKRHIHNIYEKLDVGSRTQAAAKARELGLA